MNFTFERSKVKANLFLSAIFDRSVQHSVQNGQYTNEYIYYDQVIRIRIMTMLSMRASWKICERRNVSLKWKFVKLLWEIFRRYFFRLTDQSCRATRPFLLNKANLKKLFSNLCGKVFLPDSILFIRSLKCHYVMRTTRSIVFECAMWRINRPHDLENCANCPMHDNYVTQDKLLKECRAKRFSTKEWVFSKLIGQWTNYTSGVPSNIRDLWDFKYKDTD